MRDKQAFEAYVLEKSRIEKNKIAMRRKTILTAGTALCVCLIVLMVLPGILDVGLSSDGTNGVPEALPEDIVGGTEDEGTDLPLDEAFAQNKSDYAIPDRINGIIEVTTIRQICDWVMNGNFIEGNQPEQVDCTMTIYYGKDTIVCYIAEEGFFKMGEGAWLKTDPIYVKELIELLEGSI